MVAQVLNSQLYSVLFAPQHSKSQKLRWWTCALLALIFHGLIFLLNPTLHSPSLPIPLDLGGVTTEELDSIKEKWNRVDRFIISNAAKDPNAEAPNNPRFSSTENRTVEKESRAAPSFETPKKGILGPGTQDAGIQNPRTKPISLANLSNLKDVTDPLRKPKIENTEDAHEGVKPGQQGGGRTQTILDDDLPVGAENMLNTVQTIYHSFYTRMYDSIGPVWGSRIREVSERVRAAPGVYVTIVEVQFDKDGNYIDSKFLKSSGIQAFDESVPFAWKKLPRFPNPPKNLFDKDGILRMRWSFTYFYNVDTGWTFGPPRRIDQ